MLQHYFGAEYVELLDIQLSYTNNNQIDAINTKTSTIYKQLHKIHTDWTLAVDSINKSPKSKHSNSSNLPANKLKQLRGDPRIIDISWLLYEVKQLKPLKHWLKQIIKRLAIENKDKDQNTRKKLVLLRTYAATSKQRLEHFRFDYDNRYLSPETLTQNRKLIYYCWDWDNTQFIQLLDWILLYYKNKRKIKIVRLSCYRCTDWATCTRLDGELLQQIY